MSNQTYCDISLEEIKGVLKAEKGWTIVNDSTAEEYIFEFNLKKAPGIAIRVHSSITKSGCREVGTDSIIIYAINKITNSGYIKSKRINRIQTWKKNLVNAVMDIYSQAKIRAKI